MAKNKNNLAKRRASKKERKAKLRKVKRQETRGSFASLGPPRHGHHGQLSHRTWNPKTGFSGFMDIVGKASPMGIALEIEADRRIGDLKSTLPPELPVLHLLRTLSDEELYQRLERLTGVPVDEQAFCAAADGKISAHATAVALWGIQLDAAKATTETRARVAVCAFEVWARLMKRPCCEQLGLLRLETLTPPATDEGNDALLVQAQVTFWQELMRLAGPSKRSLDELAEVVDIMDPDLSGFAYDLADDAQCLATVNPTADIVSEAAETLADVARRAGGRIEWDLLLDHAFLLATMGRRQTAESSAKALCEARPREAKGYVVLAEIASLAPTPTEKPSAAALKSAIAYLHAAAACDDADDFDVKMRIEGVERELAGLV